MDEQGILNDLLNLYLADREAGRVRSAREYQALFPGHEQLVDRELRALSDAAARTPAERFGPYRLLRLLGRGGQGTVHLAEDSRLGRRVALKMLTHWSALSPAAIARFRREAQVASRLDDPGLCAVFEAGSLKDVPFIAMRYVDGATFTSLIQATRDAARRHGSTTAMTVPSAGTAADAVQRVMHVVAAIESAARSLHKAHAVGIVHRDIKPGNLMLAHDGQTVVLDFGLALAHDDDLTALTQSGEVFGTPVYMSPEQVASGGRALDRRADVYSLAATLYECVTLQKPFAAPTRERLFEQIRFASPRDPRVWNPAIPRDLCVILEVAMAKDRDRRYQTSLDFADDLRRLQRGEPVLARPPSRFYQLRKLVRRHALLAASIAVVFSALVIGLATTLWQARRASAAERLAITRLHEVEQALARAETESRIASAVNDFLNHDLFGAATPAVARGRDIKVREVLDDAARMIAGRFAEQPLIEAAVRASVGSSYLSLDEPELAEPQLARALELRRRELGDDARKTLASLRDLASLRQQQGRHREAEQLALTALENARRSLGSDHVDALIAARNLAGVYVDQGRYREAETIYDDVVRTSRATLGERHRETLLAMSGLSLVCLTLGRNAQAEALNRAILTTVQQQSGADHPDALAAMGNLAAGLMAQGDWDEAEAMMRDGLEIEQRVFGEEHRQTLVAKKNLACLLVYRGQYAAAAEMLDAVRHTCARVLGEDHPLTLDVMANQAGLHNEQGHYREAEQLARHVLEARSKVLGSDHDLTLTAMNDLAFVLRNEGRALDAERLCQDALAGFERRYGDQHPRLLDTMSNLAATYTTQRRFAAAEPLLQRALAICRATLGEAHHSTVTALKGLAEMYYFWQHYDRSEPLFVAAIDAAEDALPEDHPETLVIRGEHGQCLLAMKRYPEAEAELLRSYEGLVRVSGPDHPDARGMARVTLALYREWGKTDLLATWQARAAER
ncbi:MAG: tetratricopeptide repeat protein [Planctomycetota bacterium]